MLLSAASVNEDAGNAGERLAGMVRREPLQLFGPKRADARGCAADVLRAALACDDDFVLRRRTRDARRYRRRSD